MLLKKLKAVSYVEVILVLVIIGVISSMAIPTMKKYTQKQEFAKSAQKAYYALNEAMDNSIAQFGPPRKYNQASFFDNYLRPSFNCVSYNTTIFTTKDGMFFYQNSLDSGHAYVDVGVDVNGTSKGPNKDGKDRHSFRIRLSNGKIEPIGLTKILYENNWTYTDELWNK